MEDKLKLKTVVSDVSSDEEEKAVENELDLPLEKLNLGPKKKLLVLCLGGLLVHRVHIRDRHTVRGLKPDVTYGKFLDKFRSKFDFLNEGSEDEKGVENELVLPLEKLSLVPKKKLVVLCLGGLLVHRVHVTESHTVRGFRANVCGKFLVFKRPFCIEFLKFCFDQFVVGLWSSARDHNIDIVLNWLGAREIRDKLAFVWCQEECITSGFGCLGKEEKHLFLKDLKDLWEKKYDDLPWKRGQYSASNTLLIDNEPHIALLNPPDNAIFPQPYKMPDLEDTFLGSNGELQSFLEGLAYADDVPTYVKEHRIGQPPITPSHPDWNYYEKIVHHFGEKQKAAVESTSK